MKAEQDKPNDHLFDWLKSTGRDPMHVSIESLRLLPEYKEFVLKELIEEIEQIYEDEQIKGKEWFEGLKVSIDLLKSKLKEE